MDTAVTTTTLALGGAGGFSAWSLFLQASIVVKFVMGLLAFAPTANGSIDLAFETVPSPRSPLAVQRVPGPCRVHQGGAGWAAAGRGRTLGRAEWFAGDQGSQGCWRQGGAGCARAHMQAA